MNIASLLLVGCNHRNWTSWPLILVSSVAFVLFSQTLSPFSRADLLMSVLVYTSTSLFSRLLNVHHLLFHVADTNLVCTPLILQLGLGSSRVLDLRLGFSHAELLRNETVFDDLINVFFLSKATFTVHVHISHLMTQTWIVVPVAVLEKTMRHQGRILRICLLIIQ